MEKVVENLPNVTLQSGFLSLIIKVQKGVDCMKYYKQVTTAVVGSGGLGAEIRISGQDSTYQATEREYLAYHARLQKLMGNLERAVAYKARVLGVKA